MTAESYPDRRKSVMIPATMSLRPGVRAAGGPEVLMAEHAAEALKAIPRALAEPDERVGGGWIAGLGLASLAMWMAAITPLQVVIPEQLQVITPHHKILALGIVLKAAGDRAQGSRSLQESPGVQRSGRADACGDVDPADEPVLRLAVV